jgi:hypothetical protein
MERSVAGGEGFSRLVEREHYRVDRRQGGVTLGR